MGSIGGREMSDTLEPNNNSHEYNGYYGITIPKEIYEAAQTLHIYFEKQMIQGWEFLSVADRRLITKLERERDKARKERDAWEKIALSNAEKLGCLLFGKVDF